MAKHSPQFFFIQQPQYPLGNTNPAIVLPAAKGKGVQKVDWDIASKMLTLHYFPALVNINKIKNRIVEAGHDLLNKKAKDNVYNELILCFKIEFECSNF